MEKCCNTLESLRIQPRRDLCERELPASPRRGSIAAMLMADEFPGHACSAFPDEFTLVLFDPEHPIKSSLEPGDRRGRGPHPHRLGFHERNLAPRPHDLGPGVEIPLRLDRRQLTQGTKRLLEMIGDALGSPLALSH